MLLLAIDTATSAITVAVHDGSTLLASRAAVDPRRHTELLAPLVAECLDSAGVAPADLTDVAVGTGPGPFTGLRVGLVTARTLGWARGIPVHGVCSLDVLARQAVTHVESGRFLVATDARRKELYWAGYAVPPGSAPGSPVERVTDPAVTRPADLPSEVRSLPAAGRGAVLYPDELPHGIPVLDVDAAVLAEVATARIATGEEMPVEALYLRRPDAAPSHAPKSTVPQGWRGA
ncbi:conserved hypothetical protein [Nostocoides japonicum T1-X7]|uniref:Gcp-like domain-containing protein n=1 Tax=Nostocoides japonicum T1-X7 TaxID=1194083 RepID=A0A077M2K4_9MICO|nr:tRNA (adenosine(37)-N6)-threonylcarbamoyltransferase complex dimerization subunit type 1 TsaB [Tetrasphaera japonica]CCH80051.1 conserved hypothetical protein [Tetrasphaera japonica T1-X7]